MKPGGKIAGVSCAVALALACAPAAGEVVPDITPPVTTIDSAPPSLSRSRAAQIGFHSSEEGSTFTCALDGAEPVKCTSPVSYDSLQDGHHEVRIKSEDPAGNPEIEGSVVTWEVDATPPVATIAGGNRVVKTKKKVVKVTFTITSEPGAHHTLSLDGGGAVPVNAGPVTLGLRKGAHAIVVTVADAAGNTGEARASLTVKPKKKRKKKR